MLKHVLVAVDGSEGSHAAVRFVMGLVANAQTVVTALTVIEPPAVVPIFPLEGFVTTTPHPSAEQVSHIKAFLAELGRDLAPGRMHVRAEVGHPVDTVLAVAKELNVDLIVVGARGLNPAQRFLVGSMSDRIVHHADRPVLVVR